MYESRLPDRNGYSFSFSGTPLSTKMNTWLCERYHLPEDLYPTHDPGIVEANYSEMDKIIKQLKEYRKVPAEAVRDVRVFDVKELMGFLEKMVRKSF